MEPAGTVHVLNVKLLRFFEMLRTFVQRTMYYGLKFHTARLLSVQLYHTTNKSEKYCMCHGHLILNPNDCSQTLKCIKHLGLHNSN